MEKLVSGSATTTSQCSSIVVPTPIAFPLTAARSGFGNSKIASKNSLTVESSDVGGNSKKSLMSFPAVKWSPSLVKITALTEKSPAASLRLRARSAYMSRVSAFIFSGRLREMVRTVSKRVTVMLLMGRGYYVAHDKKRSTLGTRPTREDGYP